MTYRRATGTGHPLELALTEFDVPRRMQGDKMLRSYGVVVHRTGLSLRRLWQIGRTSLRGSPPLLVVFGLVLAGCGGKSASSLGNPTTVLKAAQQKLEKTSGVTVALSTDDLPGGVQGIKATSGTVTNAPAFDGTLTVVMSTGTFLVPVRSVGGKVYAQIALTPGWSQVKPSDYGAPDPAQLISADQGVPAILAATADPKQGGQVRGGRGNKEVLTTYSGTVAASAVAHIIPGARGDFRASYEVTFDGELRQASLTGVFYSGKPSLTYTLILDNYDTREDIIAP